MAKQTQQDKRKQQLIDELLKDYDGPESFWGESGLFTRLKKRIIDRALDAEMDDHLGYTKNTIPRAITAVTAAMAGAERPL